MEDVPEIEINQDMLDNGFLGGTNSSVLRWIDWDNDLDSDVFLLDEDGHIRFYENIGTSEQYEFIVRDTDFLEIDNIEWFFIADFDDDNDFDIITQYADNPIFLSYYMNDGGLFTNMGLVEIENGSYVMGQQGSVPTFCDIDNDNDLDFFSVALIGSIHYYESLGIVDNKPMFSFISSEWEDISVIGSGRHGASAINFSDIDRDGDYDLIWGDYYQSSLYVIWNMGIAELPDMDNENITTSFPEDNPLNTAGRNMASFTDIDGDGDLDLFVSVLGGSGGVQLAHNIYYYENISDNHYEYVLVTNDFFNSIDHFSAASPELIDIDNDGDLDLFIGNQYNPSSFPFNGRIYYYLNEGTDNTPYFTLVDDEFLGTELGTDISPSFGDIDLDGDYDLIIGTYSGDILIYENIGNSTNFNFIYHSTILSDDDFWFSLPEVLDIDGDQDIDIICGNLYGNIRAFKQESTFNFIIDPDFLDELNVGYHSSPHVVDIDLDSDMDLLIGGANQHRFYLNDGNFNYEETDLVHIPYIGQNMKFSTGNLYGAHRLELISGVSTGGIYLLSTMLCEIGDLNQDDEIDVSDIVLLINLILDESESSDLLECSGDINQDNGLNILDIINLINLIL